MRRLLFVTAACQWILACSSSAGRNGTSSAGVSAASSTSTGTSGVASSSGGTTSGGGTTGNTAGNGSTSGGTTTGGDGGIVGLGQTCNFSLQPDPCFTSYGLSCDPASASCQLPPELYPCLSTVGCSNPGLVCTPGFQSNGEPVSACVYPCVETADCPDLSTSCQELPGGTHICFLNSCASDGVHGYFEPCPSETTDDGECLPIFADTPSEVAGVCVGTGSLGNGAACTNTRTDAGLAGLCLAGSNCTQFDAGEEAPLSSFCEPTCYSNLEVPGPGPACTDADNICFNYSDSNFYGSCLASCAGDGACPAGTGCYSFEFQLMQYSLCIPSEPH